MADLETDLLQIASELPAGSPAWRQILVALQKTASVRGPSFQHFESMSQDLLKLERSFQADPQIKDERGVRRSIDKLQGELYRLGKAAGWFA